MFDKLGINPFESFNPVETLVETSKENSMFSDFVMRRLLIKPFKLAEGWPTLVMKISSSVFPVN